MLAYPSSPMIALEGYRGIARTFVCADFLGSPELTEPIPERWIDYLVEIVSDFIY